MRLKEFNNNVANWRTIAARNNLTNPDVIMPGQVLDIGDGVVMPKGTTYTVKSGDTLSGIAQKIRRGWLPGTASTTAEPDMPVASSTQANTADTSKSNVTSPVLKPPVINLPRVDSPEFKGGGRGTMPADRNQTPPVADKAKPTRPDYHDPVYDAPVDQPIPGYKYKDAEKDKAISDKLEKQDRERQKLPTFLPPKPNKATKVPKDIPSPTDKNVAPTNDQLKLIQKSVYDQESGSGSADTSKPNYAGAIGPMQILPKTFDWVKQLGKIPKDYDIKNPEHSKAAGDALLGYYHNKFKGDPKKVYAAYYAGPDAVNKDGSINTHWRDKKNPKAPTVGQYIQQAMDRMKK